MTDTFNKILQISLYVILAISVILFVLFYIKGESMTNTVIYWAYILLAITVLLLIGFPIAFFIKNPRKGLTVLFVLIGFIILFGISYLLASDATNAVVYEKMHITANISRLIGAGLIMMYILTGITVLSLIYTGIVNAFK
ncbi:MAG: hypothetical protein IMY69_07085 [Bacteroidetes bacterium]|jgi:ABC-type transport system involved in multi-copper enzyme maturation permease subunit|nr:hypothetical protein [Bacteroidota bacterium]MCK4407694.1 hypothetical protein [Bacteroidales bacterium]